MHQNLSARGKRRDDNIAHLRNVRDDRLNLHGWYEQKSCWFSYHACDKGALTSQDAKFAVELARAACPDHLVVVGAVDDSSLPLEYNKQAGNIVTNLNQNFIGTAATRSPEWTQHGNLGGVEYRKSLLV